MQSRVAIARHPTIQERTILNNALLAALAEPSSEGTVVRPIASDSLGISSLTHRITYMFRPSLPYHIYMDLNRLKDIRGWPPYVQLLHPILFQISGQYDLSHQGRCRDTQLVSEPFEEAMQKVKPRAFERFRTQTTFGRVVP